MISIFQGCKELEYLDLSNLNVSNVTNMEFIFKKCNKLREIKGINEFKAVKLKNIIGMFLNCASLKYLDLSNFTLQMSLIWKICLMDVIV